MSEANNIKKVCVYCSLNFADTRDHVPPKSFFSKPRPSDLITVPACENCNKGAGKDEEFFLATFMLSEAGVSPIGKKLWEEKLHRMYDENLNLGLKRKIAGSLHPVELTTASGLFVRRALAIEHDAERSERVISKIVRGLYYFEYDEYLPASFEINCCLLEEETELRSAMEKCAPELRFGSRQWPGTFEYRFNRTELDECSVWLMRFFGGIVFVGITGSLDEVKN